ncbi:hypothetical protein [Paraburkholderia solisilvae]|uniref:Uncharacterized protein n=1 Tax=Paraburkholderia solisilvae TaxID=624376 RepID=A0A6J5DAL7_9BURK|nr:hypothetical protein [Paraburkholderia solisilvae]CAB3750401.1 hypothetical protein LMG29739_01081 [Paraburkholderia solisilvae]
MQKIDRHALAHAGIAGGSNKGGYSSATSTSIVVVQASASQTPTPPPSHH